MKKLLIASFTLLTIVGYAQKKATAPTAESWAQTAIKAKEQIALGSVKGLPYVSDVYRRGIAPGHISIDVSSLKELVLVTWGTADGTDYDHAVWGSAKLIRKDGTFKWLDEVKFKTKKVESNWFKVNENFAGQAFKLRDETHKRGVLAHANSLLIVDLTGGDYVKFESSIGVDEGSSGGSVTFKVLPTSGQSEGAALITQCPEVKSKLVSAIGVPIEDWLTTPGTVLEQVALKNATATIKDKSFFEAEKAVLEAMSDKVAQLNGYITLIDKASEVVKINEQLAWLNIPAIGAALKDMKLGKEYQDKYAKLQALAKVGFDGVNSLNVKSIASAKEALSLKREILMANPLIDIDKLVVTRYKLGNRARFVQPNSMGTQPNNWSCQLSASRGGFDAEIVEMSDLRSETPKMRSIFKPKGDQVITDVQLHWNADRMIFTSQDDRKHFQVFEVPFAGGDAKQVTNVPESDLEFFDAAYLPSGKMIVNTNLGYHGVPCVNGSDAVGNFALFDPKNGDMRRICFDQENNWHPTVMANGRILYTRWEYTDLMHYYSRIVFNMNPDGTENKAFYGSGSLFPNSTYDLAPIPGSSSAFLGIITGHHGVVRSGRLILFDINKGRKGVNGMVQEIPFSKREIIPLVKDELVNDVWPQFIKPQPFNDKYFLVTAKLSPKSLWGVYLVDVFDNMTLVAEVEGEGLINAIPVMKRVIPPVIPERVPMDLSKADKEATVFIQDIYEGEGLPGVPRGTVKELRVLTYEFAYRNTLSDHIAQGIQSGWDIKRELGRVKVEEDGSVIFKIPANTPISLQPLDENGAAIQLMRSWLTGQPGETVSCVGCHEDQSQMPIPKRVIASQKAPSKIVIPEGGIRPFTFELEVQPILDRACVACHNGKDLKGGIDYTGGRMDTLIDWAGPRYFSKSYLKFHPYFYRQGPEAEMAVLNPMEYHVDNSEMFQMLRAGHHGVTLTPKEWERLTTWVDFMLPYRSAFDANPYKVLNGETLDQKDRRIELAIKYANVPVDWEKEIEEYTAVLKNQPKITPTMPQPVTTNVKQIKVKGFPFTADKAKEMVAGKQKKVVDLGGGHQMVFVYVPAGEYIAGGNGQLMTLAPHKVKIAKGFWIAQNEVSNAQMRALIPTHDSRYVGQFWKDHTTPGYDVNHDEYAATKISYDEANQYAEKLATKSGLKVTIPTEEQWEWAARAGSDSDFWYGNRNTDFSKYENLADVQLTKMAVSGVDPQPMSHDNPLYPYLNYIPKDETVDDGKMLMGASGTYTPSPWGIYDINGNVAEWTKSDFNETHKVVKGGSWYERTKKATVAIRRPFKPWQKVWNVGMRLIIEE